MKDYIETRVIETANYIIKTNETIRQTAKHFNVSKSTVHKDMKDRLYKIDKELYNQVKEIIDEHMEERAMRGGLATQKKYKELRNLVQC